MERKYWNGEFGVFLAAVAMAIVVAVSTLNSACSLSDQEKKWVDTAFDAVQVGCIIANADFPDETIAKVCKITDDAIPYIKQIVDEFKAERAKFAAKQCKVGDGGSP